MICIHAQLYLCILPIFPYHINSVGLTGTAKPRNYKCRKCDKAYIGQGGLARHYRMNPDHDLLGENTETGV